MPNGYFAPEGFELEGDQLGRLYIAEKQKLPFAQNIWTDIQEIPFQSISDAAKKLRHLAPLWAYYPFHFARRGQLIQDQLPFFQPKPIPFLAPLPKTPLGSWTLKSENTILCSTNCSSPFAHGEIHFIETKEPPSRAYLKLWELFTRTRNLPKKGELVLDLGASPGGWTWVLNQIGAKVIAVDRAAMEVPCEKFLQKDAFSIHPDHFPNIQWVFSDLICYPKKLLAWIQPWLQTNVQMICTIKFQGKEDYPILEEFEKIGKLIRLFHNKHEITWVREDK